MPELYNPKRCASCKYNSCYVDSKRKADYWQVPRSLNEFFECKKHNFLIPDTNKLIICSDYEEANNSPKTHSPENPLEAKFLYDYGFGGNKWKFEEISGFHLDADVRKWIGFYRLSLGSNFISEDEIEIIYDGFKEKFKVRQDLIDFVSSNPYVRSQRLRKWIKTKYKECPGRHVDYGFNNHKLMDVWLKGTDEKNVYELRAIPVTDRDIDLHRRLRETNPKGLKLSILQIIRVVIILTPKITMDLMKFLLISIKTKRKIRKD